MRFFSLAFIVALTASPLFAEEACEPGVCIREQKNWQPSIEPRTITNGYRQGVGGDIFIPAMQNGCSILFAQALGGRFQEEWVGNIGLGYRRLFASACFAWGVNGFIDGARIGRTTLGQGGLGAEILGHCWEARINSYFPFKRDQETERYPTSGLGLDGRTLTQYDGGCCLKERTYCGFDVEAGYGRDVWCGSLWGYAGYYRFDANAIEKIEGPRLRLVYRYDGLLSCCASQLIGGLLYEYDQVHGNRFGLEIGIRIPLGHLARSACCSPSSLFRRMGYRVVRQEGILRGCDRVAFGTTPKEVMGPDGLPQEVVFVHANGLGEGTEEDPTTLDAALAEAGSNTIIVLSRAKGDIPTKGLVLKEGQSLRAFGDEGQLDLVANGLTLSLFDPCGRTALIGKGAKTVLTVKDGATVSGIAVHGGQVGIVGEGSVTLTDLTIGGCYDSAIRLNNPVDALVSGVAVRDIGDWLLVVDGGTNLTVTDLSGSKGLDNGIKITGSAKPYLEGIDLKLDGDVGIQLTGVSGPTIRSAEIDGRGGRNRLDYGIALDRTRGARLEGVNLAGITGYALLVEKASDTFVEGLIATTDADEAIRVVGGEDFALRRSTITGGRDTLLTLYDTAGTVAIADTILDRAQNGKRAAVEITAIGEQPLAVNVRLSQIRHCKGSGIRLDAKNGAEVDLTVAGNTFTSLGGTGLWAYQTGSGGAVELVATGNTLTNVHEGIALRTGTYASDSRFHYHIGDNRLKEVAGKGIVVAHEAFSKGAAEMSGTLFQNTIDKALAGIHLFSDLSKGPDHHFANLVQENRISDCQREAVHAQVDGESGGNVSFKLLGNSDRGESTALPYAVDVGARYTGQADLTMSSNTSTRPEAKISLRDQSGKLEVADLPRLSEENGAMTVIKP